jgi:hypothetical protein
VYQPVWRPPQKIRGGVEVFLSDFKAKTKKNAILWTLNLTVVPAQLGLAPKLRFVLLYEKVIHLSITEYIYTPAGGRAKGLSTTFRAQPRPAGLLLFLLMGLDFSPQRLSSGLGLLV